MRILVRLPNWLGDVMMSASFIKKLHQTFPDAEIEVIIKKGLEEVVQRFEHINSIHVFAKQEFSGLKGAYKFGSNLSIQKNWDFFFTLPDSFSAAAMAFASAAKHRIGYLNEFRSFLLTHAFNKPAGLHRVEEYCALIDLYGNKEYSTQTIPTYSLNKIDSIVSSEKYIIVNLNSEAISRRMPPEQSVHLLEMLRAKFNHVIKIIGAPQDINFIENVYSQIKEKSGIENLAGSTSLSQLFPLFQNAALVVSTDSGPAHIAAAYNTPLVVIFGAGNENNTGPFKNNQAAVVRHGKLPCEPCVKNTCRLAPLPVCLTELDLNKILKAIDDLNLNG